MNETTACHVIDGLGEAIKSSRIKFEKSQHERMDFFMSRLIVAASKPTLLAAYNRFLEVIDASTSVEWCGYAVAPRLGWATESPY